MLPQFAMRNIQYFHAIYYLKITISPTFTNPQEICQSDQVTLEIYATQNSFNDDDIDVAMTVMMHLMTKQARESRLELGGTDSGNNLQELRNIERETLKKKIHLCYLVIIRSVYHKVCITFHQRVAICSN